MNWIKLVLSSLYGKFCAPPQIECPPGAIVHDFGPTDAASFTQVGIDAPDHPVTYREYIVPRFKGNARDRRRQRRAFDRRLHDDV